MAKVGTVVIGRYYVVDVKLVESIVFGFMVCWLMMGFGGIVDEWQWRGTWLLPTHPCTYMLLVHRTQHR